MPTDKQFRTLNLDYAIALKLVREKWKQSIQKPTCLALVGVWDDNLFGKCIIVIILRRSHTDLTPSVS